MNSRTLVPILEQSRSREKIQKCDRRRTKKIAALLVLLIIAVTCAILSATKMSTEPESRRIPTRYINSETLIPEEREILRDMRTSFIPTGSVILTTNDDTFEESNVSDLPHGNPRKERSVVKSINKRQTPLNEAESWIDQLNSTETWDRTESIDPNDEDFEFPNNARSFWEIEESAEDVRRTQSEIMLQYMDTTVDPCDDFYQYACGNWALRNPIPPDKAGYDTFEMLRENLDIVLKDLLESDVPEPGSAEFKAKSYYDSCMNYELLERRGYEPLIELLDSFGGWPAVNPNWNQSNVDWVELMARLRVYNNDILIAEWVGPDIKNSDEFVIQFDQTSLGLPSRDYFLQASNRAYLDAYKSYLVKILTLLGLSPENASKSAEEIVNFEIDLADITSTPENRRNITELYKRISLERLGRLVPEIDWQRYLHTVLGKPIDSNETVVIFALEYMKDLVKLLNRSDPKTVINYLLWRFVRHRVNNLDDRFQEAKQKFYHILFGREQAPLRWKNCVAQVNTNMGMALGSMFVKKYFDEKSKNDTLVMTREIQRSFRELLNSTNWIDNETKFLAADKVDHMMLKIGYPSFILNSTELNERYADVSIHPDKYFENTLNILRHLSRTEQSRLGRPVDKALWNTAPAVVNAYYSRNKNQIMFPAGILQPPFYHRHFPKSLNYGGIGVVIGHEITHGFDDKGRLFDKYGNLKKWWHDIAVDTFRKKAQCLIDQYGLYTMPEVSMQLDGINTQGENIADNGGIKQAFRAYEHWLLNNEGQDTVLPGINATKTQLFFLNFAQIWCGSMRPEAIKNKLKTAVHSPGKFRVIGTLSNSEDFAREYECPAGSRMNPIKKCTVW